MIAVGIGDPTETRVVKGDPGAHRSRAEYIGRNRRDHVLRADSNVPEAVILSGRRFTADDRLRGCRAGDAGKDQRRAYQACRHRNSLLWRNVPRLRGCSAHGSIKGSR